MAGTSVDPPSTPLPRSHEISPEVLQTICKLYQKCPKLWADFRNVISFLDLLTENPQAYKQLYQHLHKIGMYSERQFVDDQEDDFFLFAVAVGFVERCVQFSRQIMRDMGKTYITEFPPLARVNTGFDMLCLYALRNNLLNCTASSSQFRLRLAQTGFFEDLVEDIKHIKHQSAEVLDQGNVFLLSLGTIHNCLRHPDVIPIVKRMDIVHHITPFLEKKSKEQMVKAVAIMTLSYFVDESQLDLVRLDAQMLQFFLDNIQAALHSRKLYHGKWTTSEVIRGLSNLAKIDFNKRLIVSQGAVATLVSVLGSSHARPDEEKRCAVTLLTRLVTDPLNRQVCQRDGQLSTVLKALTKSPIAKEVKDLLTLLEQHDAESDFTATSPHLAEVLADQVNMLTILGMGQVEFVLDQLTNLTAEGGNSGGDVTRVKVLQALTELAADEGCRREIMATGGLGAVKKILQRGETEEQTQAAKVVLELVSCEENRVIVKNDDALVASLRVLTLNTNSTCPELQQVAENVLQALNS